MAAVGCLLLGAWSLGPGQTAAAQPAPPNQPALTGSARLEPGTLVLQLTVPKGWHLWSLHPGPGPLPLTVDGGEALAWEGPWHGPAPHRSWDRGFRRELGAYPAGRLQLMRRVRLNGAKDGLRLKLRGQICTEGQCINQRLILPVQVSTAAAVPALAGAPLTPEDAPKPAVGGGAGAAPAGRGAGGSPGSNGAVRPGGAAHPGAPAATGAPGAADRPGGAANPAAAVGAGGAGVGPGRGGLWAFLLAAFGAGFLALATPCVFPAIPLTVSFFSKYSEASFGRGVRLAATYALSMIATYTAGGIVISVAFGAAGLNRFSAHPIFNLLLALMLVFFALNLLGMFELNPPAFLTTRANALQQRFSPFQRREGGGGLGDYLVVMVAALTATTVFFTCTVAFVGSVVVAAARGEWFWPTLGMLAFATAFSLPFFFLALFPQTARRLQGKGGSWMSATRVVLGFIELAAAFKFFSNADLVWDWQLFSRPLVLSVWVALFGLCGLFLLGKLRLGEGEAPEALSVGRMLLSAGAWALSIYLFVGLVQGRAFGGWIDGLLPPVSAAAGGARPAEAEAAPAALTWHERRAEAVAQAEQQGKLVFVNYTGYTCTNCRYMEGGVFTHPSVTPLLGRLARAELYTDGQLPIHEANREDQIRRFGTAALPFYAVERPSGEVLATFPSSTNDPEAFARFLREALAKGEAPPAPVAPGSRPAALGANPGDSMAAAGAPKSQPGANPGSAPAAVGAPKAQPGANLGDSMAAAGAPKSQPGANPVDSSVGVGAAKTQPGANAGGAPAAVGAPGASGAPAAGRGAGGDGPGTQAASAGGEEQAGVAAAPRPSCPPLPAGREGVWALQASRLSDGCPAPALRPGRWNLINLWATWCAPCREELRGFMVAEGAAFAARGGHFVTLALEEEDTVAEAGRFMTALQQPAAAALWRPSEQVEDLSPIGFHDEGLPFTALISPAGAVVWKKQGAVQASELRAALAKARP